MLDIVALLTDQDDYTKTRNYWKYLKAKLKKEKNELVSATTQLKLFANDGKRYLTDVLDYTGIIAFGKEFSSKKATRFIEWFTYSDESLQIGSTKGVQQRRAYLFGRLYDFAGQIRQKNISKGGFQFAVLRFLGNTLKQIEAMPETTFDIYGYSVKAHRR